MNRNKYEYYSTVVTSNYPRDQIIKNSNATYLRQSYDNRLATKGHIRFVQPNLDHLVAANRR